MNPYNLHKSTVEIPVRYNSFYSHRDFDGDEEEKFDLRKNLDQGHFKKDQADPEY